MKRLTIAILLATLASALLTSCNKCEKGSGDIVRITRSVPSFSQVKLGGSFNLYLRQDSVQKVQVVGDDNLVPLIETYVEGSTLVIRKSNHGCIRKNTRADVYVSIPSLTKVTLDGSGKIQGENTFKGSSMELRLDGSGLLNFSFQGSSLRTSIDGSGSVNADGSSDDASYSINGSGNINAGSVSAKNVNASIKGSGNIDLTALTSLNAHISGSGHIGYYGSPSVSVDVSGSGSVTRH